MYAMFTDSYVQESLFQVVNHRARPTYVAIQVITTRGQTMHRSSQVGFTNTTTLKKFGPHKKYDNLKEKFGPHTYLSH